jgi:hypothetical protein
MAIKQEVMLYSWPEGRERWALLAHKFTQKKDQQANIKALLV